MRWATRSAVHVDRAASAWLIRRFIDPDAEFVFVEDPDDVPTDATAFDMMGIELTHHGDHVTFETILHRYGIDDPILARLAQIVHEADVGDDLHHAPEAPGLAAVVGGLSMTSSDEETLAVTAAVFDGLYAWKGLQFIRPGD